MPFFFVVKKPITLEPLPLNIACIAPHSIKALRTRKTSGYAENTTASKSFCIAAVGNVPDFTISRQTGRIRFEVPIVKLSALMSEYAFAVGTATSGVTTSTGGIDTSANFKMSAPMPDAMAVPP